MFQNWTIKGVRISILLLLALGVFGTSLITDIPMPTEEAEAGFLHRCCKQRCTVDGMGIVFCHPPQCEYRIHWPRSPSPCL